MATFLSRFVSNRKGNFALIFAFAFPALMASIAVGVDISSTLTTKTDMQDANDAAVLLAARYFKERGKQPPLANIQTFLNGNTTLKITAKSLKFNKAKTEFTLESTATAKTYLMGYLSQKYLNYQAVSKANLGFSDSLEFALSLDTTGSMASDGKMAGLKVAANDFIDAMFDAKDRGADIVGGIVPFAQYVNVGVGNKAASWLSVPKDIDTRVTVNECRMETPVISETNCRTVCYPASSVDYPAVPGSCTKSDGVETCTSDQPAYTANYDASCNKMCDPVYGPEQKICNDVTTGDLVTWKGCVGSRAYPLNVKDSTYGKRIPGLNDVTCSVELQTLTNDRNKLKDTIASLTPSGETYMPEGIMWGVRVLSRQAPFTEAKKTAKGGRTIRKALVVMTDGMNTLSPDGAYHTKADTVEADTYTQEACAEAKTQKLEVFTISFGSAVSSSAKALLEACATSPNYFFHAKDSAALKLSFESIANEMLSVRLSQ